MGHVIFFLSWKISFLLYWRKDPATGKCRILPPARKRCSDAVWMKHGNMPQKLPVGLDGQRRHGYCYFHARTSSRSGMDTEAPARVTAIADAFAASSMAASTVSSLETAAMKYPVKVSPAAVVSTAFTGKASWKWNFCLDRKMLPLVPMVRRI